MVDRTDHERGPESDQGDADAEKGSKVDPPSQPCAYRRENKEGCGRRKKRLGGIDGTEVAADLKEYWEEK